MERKTQIKDVDIYLMPEPEGWRAKFCITSEVGTRAEEEYFEATIVFPIREPRATPDEIKLKAFDHFKMVFKDISAIVENESFASLWPKD